MGGKTSTSTQSVSIPPEILARYNAVNLRAEDTARQGFQQYSSDPNAFVAPLTAGQQAGIAGTNQYANAAQPYYGAAANLTAAGAGPINAGNLDTQRYMNPFVQNVANTTQQALQQQQDQAMSGQTGNAIRSGAFGGDRSGIAAAVAQRQNQQGMAQAIAPIYERGYSQAQQTAAQQQGVTLGAEQANAARYMQAGQQLAGLGSAAQTAGLQGAQAQLAAGREQQQTEQAGRTAMYNQFLQQQGYPFQVAQFLANIAMGTGALSGSTTTTTQPSSMFSDRRLKHDIRKIGETDDGQPIYKFKYKGDPKEQTHIGLMAQEVEKKHPEAVGLSGGYKTVDYDKATRFAEGGLVPSSMGGAVDDDVAYEGFADGGMPSLSIFGMPGGGNSRIPAEVLMQMQNMPKRELMRPAAPPQAQPNALQQAQAGLNAGKTITEGYKTGKAALFGAAPSKDEPEGSRGLLSNTGSPGMSGGWLDTIKGWGSSATPAARGGVMGYAGGGMPYGDDDADSSNILGDVVKQGQQQHASLPKPGEAPKAPQSGIGQAVQGIGALTGGIKAAQGLYTGAGKLGSMISGLGSAAEGAGAAAGAAEGLGAAAGAAGTLGSIGSGLAAAGSTAAEILPFLALLSDERAKHDKKKVGELYDGQPVYSYKYNGDNRTQLGLMAQNVERSHPEAVGSMNGLKMVDYDRATSDAADRGHFYSGGLVPRHGYQEGGPPADYSPEADLPAYGAQEIANERRQLTDRDIDYMARTMSREAANQGDEGLSGVGHVILNRFQSGKYGADIPSIVQADKQFSPWNKEAIGTRADPRLMSTDDPSYVKSAQIARAISNGEIPDPTKGALNFANPDLTNADWVRKMAADPEAIRIGQHVFGTSKGAGTGISPARTQLAARDTGTATDAPSGFRATADSVANKYLSPPGVNTTTGGVKGLLTSEKFWIPLLSGLGAMAASPSRYLGSAILTGLGGGAQAYANLDKQQTDINEANARSALTGIQAAGKSIIFDDKSNPSHVLVPDGRGGVRMVPFYQVIQNMGAYNLSPETRAEIEAAKQRMPKQEDGKKDTPLLLPPKPEAPKIPAVKAQEPKPGDAPKPIPEEETPVRSGAIVVMPGKDYRVDVTPSENGIHEEYFSSLGIPSLDTKNPYAIQSAIKTNSTLRERAENDLKVAEEIRNRMRSTDRNITDVRLLASSINKISDDKFAQTGAGQEARAAYLNLYNTIVGVGGAPGLRIDPGSDVSAAQIIQKIKALSSPSQAQGMGFRASSISQSIQDAMPSGNLTKEAANTIMASMLIELQKDRDFSRYYDAYTRRYGTALNVYDAFNREMSNKYDDEKRKIKSALNASDITTKVDGKTVTTRKSYADVLMENPTAARSFDQKVGAPGLARIWSGN